MSGDFRRCVECGNMKCFGALRLAIIDCIQWDCKRTDILAWKYPKKTGFLVPKGIEGI